MHQTVHHVLQAILAGLVESVGATDAVLVLAESMAENPHILARVGRLTAAGWRQLLQERPPGLHMASVQTARENTLWLAVFAPAAPPATSEEHSLLQCTVRMVDHLVHTFPADFDIQQRVASRRFLSVTEEELHRLVLDIHDGPVQKIFAALGHLEHLQHQVETQIQHLPSPCRCDLYAPTLFRVSRLLEVALTEIRSFVGAFRPPDFSQRSLLDILEGLVLQHEEHTGMRVHLETPPDLPAVGVPVKIAFYRILQEALANVYRHSGVNECVVRLWAHRDQVHMEVQDHGRGFDPPTLVGPTATERAEHVGLRGMRDRIHLVGGVFELDSAPGKGTRVHVWAPAYE